MICLAGKNTITLKVIDLIREKYPNIELCVVPNTTDDNEDYWQKSVKKKAVELGLRVCVPEDLYEVKDLVLISLEYDKLLLPDRFVTQHLYNVHFSLLPKYKGQFTSSLPILNGEEFSGVTLHKIDEGVDTGEIVDQIKFPISLEDTARDLYFNYMSNAYLIIKNNLDKLVSGDIISTPQNIYTSSFYSIKSLNYSDININLRKTSFEIHNQIRAFTFREYQIPNVFGYDIYKTELVNERTIGKPGKIDSETDEYLIVTSIDYKIKLYKDYFNELQEACINSNLDCIKSKLGFLPNIDLKNKKGWTLLMIASYNGNREICEFLVKQGADVNQRNYKGTNVLMYAKSSAVNSNNINLFKWLIKQGADFKCKDNKGLTVLDYAKRNNEQLIINFFND